MHPVHFLCLGAERLELSGVWQAHHLCSAPSRRPQDDHGTPRHRAARGPLQRLVGRTVHRCGLTTSAHPHAMEVTPRAPHAVPLATGPSDPGRRAHHGPRRHPGSPAARRPALACHTQARPRHTRPVAGVSLRCRPHAARSPTCSTGGAPPRGMMPVYTSNCPQVGHRSGCASPA